MKNKGFTLTELLGVMIILSILVLLVFPKVYNSVKNNKSGDKAIEKIIYGATSLYMDDNSDYYTKTNNKTYCIKIRDLVDNNNLKKPVKYKGKNDITNYMTVKATYNDGFDYEIVNNEDCIKSDYKNGDIIYFNVDTGEKCSNYTKKQSKMGTKSGCMKFYAFNDDGEDTVKLILDHNTTAMIAWNLSGWNTSGPKEVLEQLKKDTASWVGTETPTNYTNSKYTIDYSDYKARFITAQEIAKITGNTTFNEATSNANVWYYFDTNTTTASETCTSGNTTGCKYGWLYDRTGTSCTTYGCLNNTEPDTYGYWIASPVIGNNNNAYYVNRVGRLHNQHVTRTTSCGVRPVIEVLKSKLD